MNKLKLAACGIDCNECGSYKATMENDIKAAEGLVDWYRGQGWIGENEGAEAVLKKNPICKGCWNRADDCFFKCGCHPRLDFRVCCTEKQIDHCGECSDFPCEPYMEFVGDLDHHKKAMENLQSIKQMAEQKLTVEDVIKSADLNENLKKAHIEFCHFLKNNDFSIEPEGHTKNDKSGWIINFMNECFGHLNFTNVGVWIDTCDFGGSGSADDDLKKFTWDHVRPCEHFNSDGKQCGCGRQPGFNKMIFGKEYMNLCFAHLEFMNPDIKALENIKKLVLLFIQHKNMKNCEGEGT